MANNKITLNLKWCSTILLTKRYFKRPLDFEEEQKLNELDAGSVNLELELKSSSKVPENYIFCDPVDSSSFLIGCLLSKSYTAYDFNNSPLTDLLYITESII